MQKYGRWYYKDTYIEMGDLLPLPDEMKPKDPIEGMEYEITASMEAVMVQGKLKFKIISNIPEGTPLILSLEGKKYKVQNKIVVNSSETVSDWFSDKGNSIKNGFYIIQVTCPIDRILPTEIQKVFGERSRNIYGRYVKYDPISGNTIRFSYGIVLDRSKVTLIDMQQKISEL